MLIPGLGMFSFGKNKTEARITGEFYTNAIHVMEGASLLVRGRSHRHAPAVRPRHGSGQLQGLHATMLPCPPLEAFRIEYWAWKKPRFAASRRRRNSAGASRWWSAEAAASAAKSRCWPPQRGAHVMVADRDEAAAARVADELESRHLARNSSPAAAIDIRNREAIRQGARRNRRQPSAASTSSSTPPPLFPSSPDGVISDAMWATTLDVNVTANYLLADEAAKIFDEQGLDGSIVLTSSANAVVAKRGSEAYDVSKAALSPPGPRTGRRSRAAECASTASARPRWSRVPPCFPRDRVRASLTKYNIPFDESLSDDELRSLLAEFYAKRTLTHQPIDPGRLR